MPALENRLDQFRVYACVLLGAMSAALIAMPLALGQVKEPLLGTLLIVACALLGARIGYRRRNSAGFLYFALVCVLILSTLISFSLFEIPHPSP